MKNGCSCSKKRWETKDKQQKRTTVEKRGNPLTINSVYAGLSFGFFLKLQTREKTKVRNAEHKRAGTNAAGTRLGQRCPLLVPRQKSETGAP